MTKDEDAPFRGIENVALIRILGTTLRNAAAVQAAGLPLHEFKDPKIKKSKFSANGTFNLSNAGLAEYLRVSSEIAQMAADLRKSRDKGLTPEP